MHTEFTIKDVKKIFAEENHTYLERELARYAIRIHDALGHCNAERSEFIHLIASIANKCNSVEGVPEIIAKMDKPQAKQAAEAEPESEPEQVKESA